VERVADCERMVLVMESDSWRMMCSARGMLAPDLIM